MQLVDIEIDRSTMDAWSSLGFFLQPPNMTHAHPFIALDGITISFVETEGKRKKGSIVAWAFNGAPETTVLDGITTRIRHVEPVSAALHPNGITSVDHIVLQTNSVPRVMEAFKTQFKQEPRRQGTMPGGIRPGRTFAFYMAGKTVIEVVGPEHASTTDAPDSSLWGLTFNSPDLASTHAQLESVAKNQVRNAVQKGRQIFTIDHVKAGLGSCEIAVMSLPAREKL